MWSIYCCVSCPICTGAETGDGRDESNKSLQERLADAQNAQTAADAECKAADIKQKHLSKQAAEQRKSLAGKDKEATGLRQALDKAQQQVDKCTQSLQVIKWVACAEYGEAQAPLDCEELKCPWPAGLGCPYSTEDIGTLPHSQHVGNASYDFQDKNMVQISKCAVPCCLVAYVDPEARHDLAVTPCTTHILHDLQGLKYDAAAAEQLEELRRTEQAAMRRAKEEVEVLASHVTGTDFMYRDPERGWERSRVKGVRHLYLF